MSETTDGRGFDDVIENEEVGKFTRVEVIDHVNADPIRNKFLDYEEGRTVKVTTSKQDQGRTLKIFLEEVDNQ